ncbi:glycosyltransferase [Bradyrhizobium sp. BRP22]|uniref:glycosyltransferase n=1 Tax=Bradyrhizobium sp. BRP22 TaxID=2793821 RepID=UPI001CD51D58|nr:glycosyltransferase [Bradyrhizobium sp. BRP22]MCA1454185.1 glycosyltransferase [Bradyrhizobium sp. BRP22]
MSRSANLTILMTSDTVGGVWTYASALATALAASGAEVHLVTTGPRARMDQRAMLQDDRVHLIETDLALEWQDPEGADRPVAQRVLTQLEEDIEPDVIHLNSFREAVFDWNAPVLVVAHSCVNSWGLACHDTAWLEEPAWRGYTAAVAAGLSKAQAWISPSCAFYDVICDLYSPRAPGLVIRNGIAPASQTDRKEDFILAAGRVWDRAKNIAALTAAAKGVHWPISIAGPDNDAARAEVSWLGHLPYDELRARMQRAAIFASPAFYEPFGLSVLEAASAGCALLLSDIPTFRELWNGAAVFVDPTDTKGLRRALNALCTHDDERAQLQRAARTRSQRYSLGRTASAYLQLYMNLVANAQRPAPTHAMEMHA